MRKAYCQDVCECIQKKTIVRKRINQKKRKKNRQIQKKIKNKICGICFCFSSCRQKIDTERSGLRLKSRYIFLFCICGNQIPICCIALLYKNVLVFFFFFNLIYFTVFSLFFASPLKLQGCTLQQMCVVCYFWLGAIWWKKSQFEAEKVAKVKRCSACSIHFSSVYTQLDHILNPQNGPYQKTQH